MTHRFLLSSAAIVTALTIQSAMAEEVPAGATISSLDVDGRTSRVWHWAPSKGAEKGVILFSHGAASAPWKYEALISDWVEAGYSVYAPLHVDSTDHPDTEAFKGFASWTARLEDMQALADAYGTHGYVAAGHSYGGLVALTLGGASPLRPESFVGEMADPRAKLVVAFSPPGAIPNFVSFEDYATLAVPALVQTGTADILQGTTSYEPHLDAYHAAAAGNRRFGLVLDGVDHYFGGAICRPELDGPKQFDQLEAAANISIEFLEAYDQGDVEARNVLQGFLVSADGLTLTSK